MPAKLNRILDTTKKDLVRNKSISLSSIAVMTLVFLVFTSFSLFAYSAVKFLNYVETREHLEVFFNTDVPEDTINGVKLQLESTGKTAYVTYTSQEQAAEYLKQRHSDNELILGAITPEALPPSLAVRAKKIDYVPELNSIIEQNDPQGNLIYKISYNEDTTNLLKDLLTWVRIIGTGVFVVLIAVIFLVSLITVRMSITSRNEEISIMQLVGGGKWYIRLPFVFQGAFYGIMGALLASIMITAAGGVFHIVKDQSPTLSFITNFFADIKFPAITAPRVGIFFLVEIVLGAFVGAANSLFAVLRHLR